MARNWTRRSLAPAMVALVAISAPAPAQTPGRVIRIVVPFAAGSSTDVLARIISVPLSQAHGQAIIVENKPGADGIISALEVKKSPPDGTTLYLATNSPMSGAPFLHKNAGYDPVADFSPIAHLGNFSFFLVTHPSVPANTFQEFVAYAKANPDKLNYGTGSTSSIAFTGVVAALAGIKLTHIPYKSEPPAVFDLLAGRIQLMVSSYTTIAAHVRDGKLKVLLTVLPERSAVLPDVPAIAEVGLPRFTIASFAALFGPAGMSKELVERLNREVTTIVNREDIRAQLAKQAFLPRPTTADELGRIVKEQLDLWGTAIRAAGIEPE